MGHDAGNKAVMNSEENKTLKEEIQRLKMLITQRDNEIAILLSHLNKKKAQGESADLPLKAMENNLKPEGGPTLYQKMVFNKDPAQANTDVIQKPVGQPTQQHYEEYK